MCAKDEDDHGDSDCPFQEGKGVLIRLECPERLETYGRGRGTF